MIGVRAADARLPVHHRLDPVRFRRRLRLRRAPGAGRGLIFVVMIINTASIFCVRLLGAFVAARILHLDLAGVWIMLASELMIRGCCCSSVCARERKTIQV